MTFLVTGDLVGGAGALWVSLLIDLVSKGTLLLVTAWLLHKVLQTVRPADRSRLWTGLFVVLMFVPLVTFTFFKTNGGSDQALFDFLPSPVVTLVQGQTDAEPVNLAAETELFIAAAAPTAQATSVALPESKPAGPIELRRWSFLVYAWLAGFALLAGRAVMRTVFGLLIARTDGRPANEATQQATREVARQLGVTKPFRVVVSPRTRVPFVTGFFRARLVLPVTMDSWPSDRLRPVILHELAHLKHHDTFRLILGELVCALYWFNPLVWHSATRARLDQELACDDTVCRHGVRSTDYARLLLHFAAGATAPAHEVPAFARSLGLEVRLHHVLATPTKPGRWTAVRPWLLGLPMAAVMIGAVVLTGTVMVQQTPSLSLESATGAVDGRSLLTVGLDKNISVHEMAMGGKREQLNALLDRDVALLDQQDYRGVTPLAIAAWNGHLDLVGDLLTRGADPDLKNFNGLTPLFCAVDRGRSDLARLLIDNGANIMTRGYDGRGLIHMAARSGDTWVLSQAITLGADVSRADRRGVRPLDLAVWGNKNGAIRALEELNATRSDLPNPHEKSQKNADSKHSHVS